MSIKFTAIDIPLALAKKLAAGAVVMGARERVLLKEAAEYALNERRHDFGDASGFCLRCGHDIDEDNADLAAPEAHCNGGA